MVETTRICSRNGCIEGDDNPDGDKVTFDLDRKLCDRCSAYNQDQKKWATRHFTIPHESVYGIYDASGLVYIGSSNQSAQRLYEHFNTDRSFNPTMSPLRRQVSYRWKVLYSGPNYSHTEKVLIHKHKPQFNKIQYVQYNKDLEEGKSTSDWRSSLSFRFRKLLRFLRIS